MTPEGHFIVMTGNLRRLVEENRDLTPEKMRENKARLHQHMKELEERGELTAGASRRFNARLRNLNLSLGEEEAS